MTNNLIKIGALSGLIAVGGAATLVSAQTAAEQTNLTVDQIIEIALAEIPGVVTEAELETRRGNTFYDVEIDAVDGREMEMKIDAVSGEILKVSEEDKDCDDDRDHEGPDDDDGDDDEEA